MLEKLTQEQEALMITVRDKYINNFYSGRDFDKKAIEKGIRMIYCNFMGKKMPKIIYLYSPLGIQLGVNYINSWDNVGDNVRDNVGANVGANVGDNVGANVRDNVRNNKIKYYYTASYGNYSDYGWLSFYDFFIQIGIKIDKELEKNFKIFRDMVLGGVFDMIQLENYVFISALPSKVVLDERKRLHNENGFAIEFKDGFVLNYLQGQEIDYNLYPKIINDELTPLEVFAIENAEVRRIAYEYMDKSKMLTLPGYEIIDEKIDNQGNPMKIIRFDIENIGEILLYNCFCPSTGREYHLQTISRTCEEAKSKSFGDTKISFNLEF